MKMLIAALMALMAASAQASFLSPQPTTQVMVATFTAGGTGTNAIAFQNTSTTNDVRILKITVCNVTTTAITGGLVQYWALMSTAATPGGTSQVSFGDFGAANTTNATFPAGIVASTGPVNVTFEGKAGGTSQLPIIRPLVINTDETATISLYDEYYGVYTDDQRDLLLPKNTQRALILRQMQLGPTDFTAGTVLVRIHYTVR